MIHLVYYKYNIVILVNEQYTKFMNLSAKSKHLIPYLLGLFIIVVPFLTVSFGKSPFEFPKFILSLVVAQILTLILLFENISFTKNKLIILIMLFILANFAAGMLGLDPRVSLLGGEYRFQGLLLLISGAIFALSSNLLTSKKVIYKSIIISSLAISLITIFQFIMLKTGQAIPNYNGRVVATLGNPNFIGAYLVMALPFVLTLNLKNKLITLFLTTLLLISILLSFSLSSNLAVLIILTIFVFHTFWKHNKKILAGFVILLIGIVLLILSLGSSFYRYSQWDNRLLIWNAGIKSIINKPLLGVGQENFELIFPKDMHYKVDNAHNVFLETAVSSGIIGLSLYLGILYLKFKNTKLNEKLSMLGFIIAGFFNPLPIICITLFWIIVGLPD